MMICCSAMTESSRRAFNLSASSYARPKRTPARSRCPSCCSRSASCRSSSKSGEASPRSSRTRSSTFEACAGREPANECQRQIQVVGPGFKKLAVRGDRPLRIVAQPVDAGLRRQADARREVRRRGCCALRRAPRAYKQAELLQDLRECTLCESWSAGSRVVARSNDSRAARRSSRPYAAVPSPTSSSTAMGRSRRAARLAVCAGPRRAPSAWRMARAGTCNRRRDIAPRERLLERDARGAVWPLQSPGRAGTIRPSSVVGNGHCPRRSTELLGIRRAAAAGSRRGPGRHRGRARDRPSPLASMGGPGLPARPSNSRPRSWEIADPSQTSEGGTVDASESTATTGLEPTWARRWGCLVNSATAVATDRAAPRATNPSFVLRERGGCRGPVSISSTTAAALLGLFAGSFWRQCRMAAFQAAGRSRWRRAGGRGSSWSRRTTAFIGVSAANGSSPVTISYITIPSAKMSVASLICPLSETCSGAT